MNDQELRELYAGMALAGLLAAEASALLYRPSGLLKSRKLSADAWDIADAMVEERRRRMSAEPPPGTQRPEDE